MEKLYTLTNIYVSLISAEDYKEVTVNIYFNPTIGFPIMARLGMKYFIILYNYDRNAILAEAINNQGETRRVRCYDKLYNFLTECSLKPTINIMDHESSKAVKHVLTKRATKYQLVEIVICNFKNLFIAGLFSTDKNFPLGL